MVKITRRAFGALGAAVLLAPAVVKSAGLDEIRVGTIPIVDSTPLQAAIKFGYFSDVGLKVDPSPAPGGAAILPALAAGQFDFAFSNTVSTLLGVNEDLDFRIVTAGCSTGPQPPDLAGLVARRAEKITGGQQLEGKRVAVNNRNNIMSVRTAAWIEKTEGNWEKVTYVEIPFPQMADALRAKQVDVAMINEPFLSLALHTHGGELEAVGWPLSQTAPSGVVSQYVSTQRVIDAKPKIIEAFAVALGKGVAWTRANIRAPEGEALISDFTRIPAERLKEVSLPVYDSVVVPQKVADLAAVMTSQKLLRQAPDLRTLIYATALVDHAT
jgi:NitT/TauT family transport system substrate-binding protein